MENKIQLCMEMRQFHIESLLLMLSNAYLAEYEFQGCGTTQGPNLPSMVPISSAVQVLLKITSTYGTLVFGPTFMPHLFEIDIHIEII